MKIQADDISLVQNGQTKQNSEATQKSEKFAELLKLNDLNERELKKLTFEEAKALQLQREKDGSYRKKEGAEYAAHFADKGSSLLQVTTLTNDDAFNKAVFEKMKEKEIPSFYLEGVKHNMDYSQGRRKHPYPTLSVTEVHGNFNALSREEINNLDLDLFLKEMINIYTELLRTSAPYIDKEKAEQNLNDFEDIQNNYNKYKEKNDALLKNMLRGNSVNPLDKVDKDI